MRRETTFKISHRPFAVHFGSFRARPLDRQTGRFYDCVITAVWFRRQTRVTAACIGLLRDTQATEPASAAEFLERHRGVLPAMCTGRWDGSGYWGAEDPETRDGHMGILVPMLASYPDCPPGFDGWWTTHKPRKG